MVYSALYHVSKAKSRMGRQMSMHEYVRCKVALTHEKCRKQLVANILWQHQPHHGMQMHKIIVGGNNQHVNFLSCYRCILRSNKQGYHKIHQYAAQNIATDDVGGEHFAMPT